MSTLTLHEYPPPSTEALDGWSIQSDSEICTENSSEVSFSFDMNAAPASASNVDRRPFPSMMGLVLPMETLEEAEEPVESAPEPELDTNQDWGEQPWSGSEGGDDDEIGPEDSISEKLRLAGEGQMLVAPLGSVEPSAYHPGPLNSLTMDRNLKKRIHGDAEGGIGASRMMTNAESLNSVVNIATTNGRLDTQGSRMSIDSSISTKPTLTPAHTQDLPIPYTPFTQTERQSSMLKRASPSTVKKYKSAPSLSTPSFSAPSTLRPSIFPLVNFNDDSASSTLFNHPTSSNSPHLPSSFYFNVTEKSVSKPSFFSNPFKSSPLLQKPRRGSLDGTLPQRAATEHSTSTSSPLKPGFTLPTFSRKPKRGSVSSSETIVVSPPPSISQSTPSPPPPSTGIKKLFEKTASLFRHSEKPGSTPKRSPLSFGVHKPLNPRRPVTPASVDSNQSQNVPSIRTRQSSSSIVESITYCQSQRQTTTSSQHSSANQTRDNSHPSIKSTGEEKFQEYESSAGQVNSSNFFEPAVKGESEVTLNEPNPTENQYYIEKEMQDPLEGVSSAADMKNAKLPPLFATPLTLEEWQLAKSLPPTPIPTPPPPPKVERLPLPAISPLQPRKRPSVVINVSEDEELEVSEELAKLYYDICVSGLGVTEIWDRVANGEY